MLDLDVDERHDEVVVSVTGEVDVVSSPELRDCLAAIVERGHRRLVVDLRDLEFIDSSGLGVLIGILKRAGRDGGTLRVRNASPRIARVFRTTGLARVFQLDEPE